MVDPLVILAAVEAATLVVLVGVTGYYALSTRRIAIETEKNIQQTGKIIDRADNEEVIKFCEARLEKIYSPIFHGEPTAVNEEHVLGRMAIKGDFGSTKDTIQYPEQLRNQINQYIFLATGDFQVAWKQFKDTWWQKSGEQYNESLARLVEITEADYHMYESMLGDGIRKRHPRIEDELKRRREGRPGQ